jgi:hypothetical protein
MALYASRILRLTIEMLKDRSVKRVCFVSGMSPAFVNGEGVKHLDLGILSSKRIGEMRELCRVVADEPLVDSDLDGSYSFVLRHIGRVHCTFQQRGDSSCLVVARDSDALEMVDAIRPRRPPALRAEAKPEAALGNDS